MAPSRVIVLGIAGIAAIGAGLIARNMTSAPAPIVMEQAPSRSDIAADEVLVIRQDITMGSALTDSLAWQQWPRDGVQEYFVTRNADPEALERLQNSVARVPLYAGEPLRADKLIGEGQSFMATILPSGKRAVATQISASTSAGGFILPDDRVDVIMTRRAQTGDAEGFITETILRNIRVLAIDQTIQEDEEGRRVRVGETATLELTSQQAEIITVAQQMADRLTLALRPVVDANEQIDAEADYLVSGSGRRGTVRMIRSGEISEIGAR
ncbi:MAG: Flp pilus assembly protein CpaB [Mesorhizobium sp.]|nr:Flp pilus assembly protein CpaB [Mesorhizobium sp.]